MPNNTADTHIVSIAGLREFKTQILTEVDTMIDNSTPVSAFTFANDTTYEAFEEEVAT